MGYSDQEEQRAYQRRWKAKRRADWFALHGPCVWCGSTVDLQLDHVDPATKIDHNVWSWSAQRRDAELAKCRVLCKICHDIKSATERAKGEIHGQSVLTTEQVLLIKISDLPSATLARLFGVHRATVGDVRRGRTWKHVKEDLASASQAGC